MVKRCWILPNASTSTITFPNFLPAAHAVLVFSYLLHSTPSPAALSLPGFPPAFPHFPVLCVRWLCRAKANTCTGLTHAARKMPAAAKRDGCFKRNAPLPSPSGDHVLYQHRVSDQRQLPSINHIYGAEQRSAARWTVPTTSLCQLAPKKQHTNCCFVPTSCHHVNADWHEAIAGSRPPQTQP